MAKREFKKIQAIPITLIAIASSLLLIVVIGALLMRPVADDFSYFSDPHFGNPIGFAVHYYLDWTGRFAQAGWMSGLFKLFGKDVVIYGTILQLLLLTGVSIAASYAVLKKLKLSHTWVVALGMSVAVFATYMTKSFFDTNLWITSSTVYLGSAIGILAIIAATALLLNSKVKSWWLYLILFVVTFGGQLFSEPTSIIVIYLAALALLVAYLFVKNKRTVLTLWTTFAGAIAGFLFMYLAPGTASRQDTLEKGASVVQSLKNSLGDFDQLAFIFTSYRLLLILVLAIALVPVITMLTKKHKVTLLSVASVSAFVIPLILFFAIHYTLNGYTPARAYTVPSMLFGITLAIAIASILSFIPVALLKKYAYRTAVITPVIIIVGLIATLQTATATAPVLQAVAQRTMLYDLRESAIAEQLQNKAENVEMTPLPILLTSTDATDLYYNDNTPPWLEKSFKDYYGIPNSSSIIRDAQPEGYCVTKDNPYWFGTQTCEDLDE